MNKWLLINGLPTMDHEKDVFITDVRNKIRNKRNNLPHRRVITETDLKTLLQSNKELKFTMTIHRDGYWGSYSEDLIIINSITLENNLTFFKLDYNVKKNKSVKPDIKNSSNPAIFYILGNICILYTTGEKIKNFSKHKATLLVEKVIVIEKTNVPKYIFE